MNPDYIYIVYQEQGLFPMSIVSSNEVISMLRFLLLLTTSIAILPSVCNAQEIPQKIAIIKADDVRGGTENWDRFFAVSKERNVKVAAGVICNSLTGNQTEYFEWLRVHATSGQVEFWNHGWDHRRWQGDGDRQVSEFSGSGYEHQKTHFEESQELMARVLGTPPVTFGPPFNAFDQDTVRVMSENDELQAFFTYSSAHFKKKLHRLENTLLVPMKLRGEHNGAGRPDFEAFKTTYFKQKDVSFTAIQFHPNAFGEEHFDEYARILDFLISEGWVFMLPREYVDYVKQPGTKMNAICDR